MSPGRAAAIRAAQARMGELGLTQEALAKHARVDLSTVNTFLNGHTWPQVRTRAQIETALNWPVGELSRIASGTSNSAVPIDLAKLQEIQKQLHEKMAELDAEISRIVQQSHRRS